MTGKRLELVKSCPAHSEQTVSLPNNPLGALKSWPVIFTQKCLFSGVQTAPPVFQIVPTASCPVGGHYWKDPGSVLFASFPQIFVQIDGSPPEPPLSNQKTLIYLTLSLYKGCSCPLIIFMSLCRTPSRMSICTGESESGHRIPSVALPELSRWERSSPLTCW